LSGAINNAYNYAIVNAPDLEEMRGMEVGNVQQLPEPALEPIRQRDAGEREE
jgi:hypothetical protein